MPLDEARFNCVIVGRCPKCRETFVKERVGEEHKCDTESSVEPLANQLDMGTETSLVE